MPNKRIPKPSCIGARYTFDEELAIMRAKREAARYMEGYGKGATPTPIDKSHYIPPLDNNANDE